MNNECQVQVDFSKPKSIIRLLCQRSTVKYSHLTQIKNDKHQFQFKIYFLIMPITSFLSQQWIIANKQKMCEFNTSQIEESPNKDSFNHYLQDYSSPNCQFISRDKQKSSIVTRIPLYGPKAGTTQVQNYNEILEKLSSLSQFTLDQEEQSGYQKDNQQIALTK
ncbi:unnamed protein product (macronuclear) [Paramecium tetraurelia]|uniref:Uncharacterized protein n=1 Tax=Paramecium tetraurelia TaxID=5888 RepID=A0DWJ5_PARTE|nr:uncharacterized protein GSPATT00021055001 [Paramecium tetraurelia]CAK87412.1 unnamed protein product [Paramecium tetraurelia]|eukprot:XP_001454809.1 hypothetical protein (macronuclear) [Paramecium tetraurelia strain d4-2]